MVIIENLVSWHCHVSCFVFKLFKQVSKLEIRVFYIVKATLHLNLKTIEVLYKLRQHFILKLEIHVNDQDTRMLVIP
jgi:hypothetical protein